MDREREGGREERRKRAGSDIVITITPTGIKVPTMPSS